MIRRSVQSWDGCLAPAPFARCSVNSSVARASPWARDASSLESSSSSARSGRMSAIARWMSACRPRPTRRSRKNSATARSCAAVCVRPWGVRGAARTLHPRRSRRGGLPRPPDPPPLSKQTRACGRPLSTRLCDAARAGQMVGGQAAMGQGKSQGQVLGPRIGFQRLLRRGGGVGGGPRLHLQQHCAGHPGRGHAFQHVPPAQALHVAPLAVLLPQHGRRARQEGLARSQRAWAELLVSTGRGRGGGCFRHGTDGEAPSFSACTFAPGPGIQHARSGFGPLGRSCQVPGQWGPHPSSPPPSRLQPLPAKTATATNLPRSRP